MLSCELHNPYQGIDASQNTRHNIKDIGGQPLLMGIYVDGITDIGRIENVHFKSNDESFALAPWMLNQIGGLWPCHPLREPPPSATSS